jgi:hypothetical protein
MTEQSVLSHPIELSPEELIAHVQALDSCSMGELQGTPLPKGNHNVAYLCWAGPKCLPEQFVLRYPRCSSAAADMEATDYTQRNLVLDGLRTPKVLRFGRMACGMSAIIEEYINGVHKDFDTLTNVEVAALAREVSEVHHRTSAYYSEASGPHSSRSKGTYADYIRCMVAESVTNRLRLVDMTAYAGADEMINRGKKKLEEQLQDQPELFAGEAFSLLHHDLSGNNILWKPDGEVVLIDWNITYGDPADDLDYIFTDNGTSEAFKQAFLAAYTPAKESGDVLARIDTYTLKNRLDDAAWGISMKERNEKEYKAACEQRLEALRSYLAA